MYAIVDNYPFVWPATPEEREVAVGFDGETLTLRTLSAHPRVLESTGAVSAEESAAIARLAEPVMEASAAYEEGLKTTNHSDSRPSIEKLRNSATGWIDLSLAKNLTGYAALLKQVWLRLAALVRQNPRSAEAMQAVTYDRVLPGFDPLGHTPGLPKVLHVPNVPSLKHRGQLMGVRPSVAAGQHYYYHADFGLTHATASRAITVLLYLNDDFVGGETSFALAGSPDGMSSIKEVRGRGGGGSW